MEPLANLWLIRAFDGPIHRTLMRIWDAIAEYEAPHGVRLNIYPNEGAPERHGEALNSIWAAEVGRPERYFAFTEYDFLPELRNRDWLGLETHGDKQAMWGAMYATRGCGIPLVQLPDQCGGWFFVIDKLHAPRRLAFDHKPDPANQLPQLFDNQGLPWTLHAGDDTFLKGHGHGVQYHFGTHLFWSRHYNDPPETQLGPWTAGEIQRGVRDEIKRWFSKQPQAFRDLYVRRFGSDGWECSCASTAGLAT
jgi:hypothetical protein